MRVLFQAWADFHFIFHLPQQESAGESKTSTTAQVCLLFQIFSSFINKCINSTLSSRDEAKSSVSKVPK